MIYVVLYYEGDRWLIADFYPDLFWAKRVAAELTTLGYQVKLMKDIKS